MGTRVGGSNLPQNYEADCQVTKRDKEFKRFFRKPKGLFEFLILFPGNNYNHGGWWV